MPTMRFGRRLLRQRLNKGRLAEGVSTGTQGVGT
jgi:exopolysaccharide production protein ExoZ